MNVLEKAAIYTKIRVGAIFRKNRHFSSEDLHRKWKEMNRGNSSILDSEVPWVNSMMHAVLGKDLPASKC